MTKRTFIILLFQIMIIVGGLVYMNVSEHNSKLLLLRQNKLLRYAAYRANLDNEQLPWTRQERDRYEWYWQQTKLRNSDWTEITEIVYDKAQQYRLRPELVMAIIHRESNFDPVAQSYFAYSSNPIAQGLMQVNTTVWRNELNIDENRIMDAAYNIDLGCKILRIYMDESNNDETKAAILYNCGYKLSNPRYVPLIKSSPFYRR